MAREQKEIRRTKTSKNPGNLSDKIRPEMRNKQIQVNLSDFLDRQSKPSLSISEIHLL